MKQHRYLRQQTPRHQGWPFFSGAPVKSRSTVLHTRALYLLVPRRLETACLNADPRARLSPEVLGPINLPNLPLPAPT